MSHVFGPVPSRRLGRSLGVDLVPFKTCTYDCLYCQLGRTTNLTIEQREWVSLDEVIEELEYTLATQPDYITLSGSGEPTLHTRLGDLIERIRSMTRVPVAVLTNGSLLWRPELRAQLRDAHLVVPSLDAGNEAVFRAINRPHSGIAFEQVLEGLIDFRREYSGDYWLEIFLIDGCNTDENNLRALADCVRRVQPDLVQLNTATRPPAEKEVWPVPQPRLEEICARFQPVAEVIADYNRIHEQTDFKPGHASVLEMVMRRPCSIEDIAAGLGMHRNEVLKYVEYLLKQGQIDTKTADGRTYYCGKHEWTSDSAANKTA